MKKIICIATVLLMLVSVLAGCSKNNPLNVIYDDSNDETSETPSGNSPSKLVSISYPEPISFDDYEAQRELREQNQVDASIVDSINGFSFDSASVVLREEDGNACYSPISLYMALALLTTGTNGEVFDELTTVLREDDTAYLSEQMGKLFRRMYTDNEISKLYMANSLWINEVYPVKQEFKDNAMQNFYAAANNLDFADEKAGETISGWISDNTEGLLKPKIDVNPEYLMYIINTIYLNDEWHDNFSQDATKEDVFNLSSGETVNAHFMNRQFSTGVIKGEGYTAASLDMKSTGRMVFVLPNEDVDLSSLIASPELLVEMTDTEKEQYAKVNMSLPKFDFESKFDLEKSLMSLGIEKAFDAYSGGFTGISDFASCISEVNQGSKIAIDENGVEAAAYTSISVDTAAADVPDEPIEFNLNRPFIFIVQSKIGVPLFIGVVQDPTKE